MHEEVNEAMILLQVEALSRRNKKSLLDDLVEGFTEKRTTKTEMSSSAPASESEILVLLLAKHMRVPLNRLVRLLQDYSIKEFLDRHYEVPSIQRFLKTITAPYLNIDEEYDPSSEVLAEFAAASLGTHNTTTSEYMTRQHPIQEAGSFSRLKYNDKQRLGVPVHDLAKRRNANL